MTESNDKLLVRIESYSPLLFMLSLFCFGHKFECSLEYDDMELYRVMSGDMVLKRAFRSYEEAENYCMEMEYAIEVFDY